MKLNYFLICILFTSCTNQIDDGLNQEINETAIDSLISFTGVRIEYNGDGSRKKQLLIANGDTVHIVEYNEGKIISSEGQYISTLTTVKQGKTVDFEFNMINIDTLKTVVVLDYYNDSTEKYEVAFSFGRLDTTYYKYTHEFEGDSAHVLCRVLYGNDDGVLFEKHSGFHTIIFGPPAKIVATPKDSKQMTVKY